MDDFYQLLDLFYQYNKKYPQIKFGELVASLIKSDENLSNISNEEIVTRLNFLITEEWKN